jgi:hypothetical protein
MRTATISPPRKRIEFSEALSVSGNLNGKKKSYEMLKMSKSRIIAPQATCQAVSGLFEDSVTLLSLLRRRNSLFAGATLALGTYQSVLLH